MRISRSQIGTSNRLRTITQLFRVVGPRGAVRLGSRPLSAQSDRADSPRILAARKEDALMSGLQRPLVAKGHDQSVQGGPGLGAGHLALFPQLEANV